MRLDVNSLSFSYGKGRGAKPVFSDVSFSAQSGQTVCLLGHNGAGKSTLFKCLLGLLGGYAGSIRYDDKELAGISRRELSTLAAYIPQTSDPTFDYSVIDVVLMGRTSRHPGGASTNEEDERIALEALDRLGIVKLAPCGYARISGGERQLVLIARALAQQSAMLVMDEPTANLDYGNSWRTMRLVDELRQEGYLVIMSTHDPQQALTWATNVLVIHEGGVVSSGPPKEALTPQVMERIYGIRVDVLDVVDTSGNPRMVCIPQDSRD